MSPLSTLISNHLHFWPMRIVQSCSLVLVFGVTVVGVCVGLGASARSHKRQPVLRLSVGFAPRLSRSKFLGKVVVSFRVSCRLKYSVQNDPRSKSSEAICGSLC